MIVKHKTRYPKGMGETLGVELGDCVDVLSFNQKDTQLLQGKNLRTGAEGSLYWNAFKWVGVRQVCGCDN